LGDGNEEEVREGRGVLGKSILFYVMNANYEINTSHKAYELQKDGKKKIVYTVYIDLVRAYNRASRKELWNCL